MKGAGGSGRAAEGPLEVLIVGLHYSPEPSGNAPYTTGLAQGLAAHGHRTHVITSFPHYPQWRIQAGYTGRTIREEVEGVSLTRLRPSVPRHPTLLARLLMELRFGVRAALSRWGRPDVAVLVSPALFATAVAAVAAKVRRVPSVIWVQDIYSLGVAETGQAPLAARVMQMIERTVLRSGHTVVVIHERFRRFLVAELGVPADKVVVVRNWSHLQPAPEVDRLATRRRLGWADDEVIVLHAGNMGVKQGLENVVDAASLAADRRSPARFVMLGDGNQRSKLEQLSRGDRITFVDPLPDEEFSQALHSADVLLVNERPGLNEMSVPSKLTSYFSTGLPVLAATGSSSVTAGELEQAGGGLRVDAADPLALLLAAETLAADPERAQALGRAGQRFRIERLSEKAALDAFQDLLRAAAVET